MTHLPPHSGRGSSCGSYSMEKLKEKQNPKKHRLLDLLPSSKYFLLREGYVLLLGPATRSPRATGFEAGRCVLSGDGSIRPSRALLLSWVVEVESHLRCELVLG